MNDVAFLVVVDKNNKPVGMDSGRIHQHAAMESSTIMPETLEYSVATLLSISMLLVGFVALNKNEEEAPSGEA